MYALTVLKINVNIVSYQLRYKKYYFNLGNSLIAKI